VLASLGLPGLGNFIAEFLILAGAFRSSVLWAVLATVGLISSMIYSLVILQRIFHGQPQKEGKLVDFSAREFIIMACLIIVIFWLGFFPQKVISTVSPVFDKLEQQMNVSFSPGQGLLQGASEGQVSPEDALRLNRGEPSIVYLRNNTKGGARW
jgi:NADH-quinone oxidoreductase subunit M